jgi:hypothetical protein
MGAGKTSGFQGLLANQQILERWIDFGELDKFQSSQPKLGGPIFHRIYQNHPSTVVKASTLPKIAIHRKDDFIK